jgi:hypothetical protein
MLHRDKPLESSESIGHELDIVVVVLHTLFIDIIQYPFNLLDQIHEWRILHLPDRTEGVPRLRFGKLIRRILNFRPWLAVIQQFTDVYVVVA